MDSQKSDNTNEILKKDLVSIVILTYNQVEYTKLCVQSIENFVSVDYELIFVDNASTDGTLKYLTDIVEKNKNYILIKNSENLGYAAGNNMGINIAKGEFVLVMNNDILVTPGAVNSLLNVLKDNDKTALSGPKTNFVNGSQLDLEAEYNSVGELVKYAEQNSVQHKGRTVQVKLLIGFMFLARTKLMKDLGGFDGSFAIENREDNDMCRKLAEKGYDLQIALDSFVHHFGHVSFKASNIDYNDLINKNQKLYEDKWSNMKSDENRSTLTEETIIKLQEDGNRNAKNGLWDLALKSFSDLVKINENSVNFLNYGVALWETGDHKASFESFKNAIKLDATNKDAIVNLVEAGYDLDKYSEVESSLILASKRGGSIEITSLLADCQYRQGEYEKAINTLNGLLINEPENEELQQFLNLISTEMNEMDEAEALI